jgi:hypothetical protein
MPTLSVERATEYLWRNLDLASDGRCAIWIGSGLSRGAYVSWEQAISQLAEVCGVSPPPAGAATDLIIDTAQECKSADEEAYHQTLVDLYAPDDTTASRRAYNLLWSLDQANYITTNYDQILYSLSLAPDVGQHIYPNLSATALGYQETQVHYIHGMARRNQNCEFVMARSEFRQAYENPGYLTRFLQTLFSEHDILFVGSSLSEPALVQAFRRSTQLTRALEEKIPGRGQPSRIILLPVPEGVSDEEGASEEQRLQESQLEDLGVDVVWYRPDQWEVQHELETIFQKLCELNRNVHQGPGQTGRY